MDTIPAEFRQAYRDHDRELTIRKTRLGCFIGIVLVPMFAILDHFVYPAQEGMFLMLRLLCSLLMASLYPVLGTALGRKYYHAQGVLILLMPTATIAWMVHVTDGAQSGYYAGLNLVLMVLAVVLDWTFWQSLASVLLVLFMYLAATLPSAPSLRDGAYVTNLFFLVSTGIAIVTGAQYHSKIRIREFISRCELDKSRKALEASNQKLVELDQVKNRFFANLSHELRTPLTLLLAPLETLLHRFPGALDAEARAMLVTMHSNGMRLLKLINDLLDLVRLESGRMEVRREAVTVAEFVKGLVSAARQVADDKGLGLETLVAEDVGTVMADRDKLEKILLNLLFNALKFTPAGGKVELRAEKDESYLILRVTDTGVGIAAKNLPHIFDRFWQADGSSRRKYQGVGIGLALVKELVEIQGGIVKVESEEGKGTTFTVRLPWQPSPGSAAGTAEAPEAQPSLKAPSDTDTISSEEWLTNLYRRAELFPAITPVKDMARPAEHQRGDKGRTVLVADDEPDMLRFLKSQLVAYYEVIEAVDGQQAVDKASQCLPDIILLDMMMPGKDGIQACREIRGLAATQNIPIVMLTARADEETKLMALSAGASDFLAKPFSTTELLVRLKNLVESHQYQRKLAKQKVQLESTIDQLKETETQLVQVEKMASLGRLSAGIIHEINNPLNFARTGLFTLRKKGKLLTPEQQPPFEEILQDVEEGLQRVQTIVSDLREFSHPEMESRDHIEVAEVVGSALRFLSGEWKHKVNIEQKLPEQLALHANKNKLTQLLVNMLQNSLDALKAKAFANGDVPTIWVEGRSEPSKTSVVIRDNGLGIDPKNVGKIFEPFFTTKDVGEGMGLGLAICHRIVREHDGRITVRSEQGKFCEFTLEFPAGNKDKRTD